MADADAILNATCPAPHHDPERVQLGHGSGGRLTAQLIEELILPALSNPILARLEDHATVELEGGSRLAFTTDSYVVTPIFFPGGDIGELAVNGTINDLAVGGAEPLALSLGLILEEGLPMAELRRVISSIRAAAARAGVAVVTGDTKVVGRGSCDRMFINTSGIGRLRADRDLGAHRVQVGDAILVSGTIADHGMAIMACREGIELGGGLASDTAALHELTAQLLARCPEVHAMRDPTRGGVAATLTEIASRRQLGMIIDEAALPVRERVRGACELLGLDPLLVANEGKLVVFVPAASANLALAALRAHPLGGQAACIGEVVPTHPGSVVSRTPIGGQRIVELPFAEPLPRIC